MISAIVTDIEGTTSSIDFVHKVLFPYATRNLPEFVRNACEQDEISTLLDDTRAESGDDDASLERVIEILLGWIDADRKATSLKALQGHIWRFGYERGDFTGHIYRDAADQLRQWSDAGIELYVYSSGSVDAQKLLFAYSDVGDLRRLFNGYFDTRVGQKKDPASYAAIVSAIGRPASDILFLSDVVDELDAARATGMRTTQLVRTNDLVTADHPLATTFDDVIIEAYDLS